MTPLELILAKLDGARQRGDQWEARCPAHDDGRASLSIGTGEDGTALLTCFAGCDVSAICAALGLTPRDLFSKNRNGRSAKGQTSDRRIVATYDYCDEQRTLLYQVCRYDPKDFRPRRPEGNGGWRWDLTDTRRVVYRLPELLAADPTAIVYVVEGEKDADQLAQLGLVATTNAGGAGKWRTEYNEAFRGRRVVILPDNDDPGRKHAVLVRTALADIATSVRVVNLPDLPPKGDVSDYLATHAHAEFEAVVAALPRYDDRVLADGAECGTSRPTPRAMNVRELLELEIIPREYLLEPIFREKELGMLHAWRGVGKTYAGLEIGFAVASGGALLGWKAPRPRRVLYIDGEMPGRTMQERLAAIIAASDHADAFDAENLRLVCADFQPEPLPSLSTREGQAFLEPLVADSDFVVVDSISTLAGYGKENEAESWLPMQAWALALRRRGKSVLLLHHDGKGGQQRGTSRREDILDVVIHLRHPTDYEPQQGARFEVHFEKARGMYGKAVEPFEAALEISGGRAAWTTRTLADTQLARAAALYRDGAKPADVAQ